MINRVKKNFTNVWNEVLINKEISLKAKGLYAYLCSKPDNWRFSYKGIVSQLKESNCSVRKAIKELVNNNYLLRYSVRTTKGYIGWEWIINPTVYDLQNYLDPIFIQKTKSKDYHKYLLSSEWKSIAKKIRKRDEFKCTKCNSSESLQVHHTSYDNIFNERNHLEDLILLCDCCHKKEHNIKEEV